jgi:type IV pilus assembly protein PilY1
VFASNIPNANACTTGGDSWLYELDFRTGQYVSNVTNQVAATRFAGAFHVGINVVTLPNGKSVVISTLSDDRRPTTDLNQTSGGSAKRVSWRELLN